MIFENKKLTVDILSFTAFYQENVVRHSLGRNFDALSFRFHADTDLITPNTTYHVHDNYVCFVPAGLDYDRVSKKEEVIAINCRVSGYKASEIECFLPKDSSKLASLFKKAYECWTKKGVGYYHRCIGYFYQILAECSVQNAQATLSESKIQSSVDFIKANYTKSDLQISEIASKSFISEVYFRKLFKAEFGMSPQKYIIKLRLQKASELIETGDYSLKEIAFMSGYNDYKYFSSEFKLYFGVSPSEYGIN